VTGDLILFLLLALGLVGSALVMVTARNVVHGVIAMVANFALTGALYLVLHAPFLFVVQITVYAGAIMVLFLFVVMILGTRDVSLDEPLVGQRFLGVGAVAVLGGLLVWVTSSRNALPAPPAAAVPADFGSPAAMGQALFSQWVLPFEVVSVLLLVAVIGAVVIGQYHRELRGVGTGTPESEEGEG
jgi:NADH-quinone oxidoreductase subunit J